MSEPTEPPTAAAPAPPAPRELTADERRRRRAAVFGDVLPDTTADERGDGESGGSADASEEWLRRQVPPHHG